MPDHYCFVCASNEGVFLDVTPDNRSTFGDQIRTCLSTKINESIDLSNKICYKCAYELDQCTKFVQRYRNSHKVPEPKIETSMRCCFLCYELVESNRIFDISKDKSVFNPLRKIRSIFNDDINKKNNSWLICLTCRYNLDVLYDLKRIYQDSFNNLKALINEEINYSNYPKIHTDVVNRKTTITTFPDITFYGSINSDSDSNEDMARGKRHIKGRKARSNIQMKPRNNKSKVRSCDKCHNTVANDIDMYRFYHTGLTVCKNCWITMDPSIAKSQRRSRQNQFKTETKLCAVFLKDVLSQSLKKEEKDETHEIEKNKTCETEKGETHETEKHETCEPKKDKIRETEKDKTRETMKDKACEMEKNEIHNTEKDKAHEKEKDKDDNASFVNSQEEAKYSEESSSLSISPKMRNHIVNGKARRGKKRKIGGIVRSRSDVERTPSKVTRVSEHTNTNEEKSPKMTIDTEQQLSTQLMKTRGRKRIDNRSSDSESSQKQKASVDAEQQSSTQQTKKRGRKRLIDNRSSDSDSPQKQKISVDAEQQSNAHLTKTRGRKRIMDNRSSDSEDSQKQKETDKIKLNESVNNTKKKQKIKGTTSSARSDSSDEISIEEDKSLKNRLKATSSSTAPTKKEQESNIRSRTRSSSMSSTEMTSTEFKSPKSLSQSEVKTEYTCDKCNKKFDSKLASAKHKLTHLKQAALKLEKITVANIKVKQETDLISQDEISEETMSRSDRTSVDKCTDDSEDAIVNIEDNTNDEPCSLGDTKNAKEKMEEKKSVESDTDEKPDIAMNESRLEESINDEKTKSEKCENSVIPDNRVIEDDEGKSNKNVKDEYTTKKEDKTSDRDNDKFEDNDAQEATIVILEDHKNMENENEEEDKNVEIKNDTEVSSTEKENIINECNKDNEEVTSDNEMTSLSILSNNRTKDNKDQDENFENNLENNFIDDDREIIEKPEIQSDLIDESSKIHIEESEENLPEILPIDETETLNEKNDLDDIIAIDEEIEQLQQQQKSNEENTEVEIIADIDEPNSVRDMPDLLNGETHDEVMEDVEDITINSDDGTKKEIEDTVQTDKHRKLEEELKELEELVVESNAMNNKYEVQEDSTYVPDNSSADAATEILKEVFDLAAAEVQQREEIITKTLVEDVGMEMETLENISREIRKSADMPSLDPISVMDIDDDGIMLN
ncbi:PREDICTED: nipped-B-like protein B isoform X1 [Atta colombica]|uniref:nipped-B-like protein B isoform X1 n=1 Tax=Atta colombica TaxID=520822 RepID=UPI00084CD4F1|nr:PREDICTED: nipped-B-like protein B isoform X1 [Atta colombica]